jgi:hypothetical protein
MYQHTLMSAELLNRWRYCSFRTGTERGVLGIERKLFSERGAAIKKVGENQEKKKLKNSSVHLFREGRLISHYACLIFSDACLSARFLLPAIEGKNHHSNDIEGFPPWNLTLPRNRSALFAGQSRFFDILLVAVVSSHTACLTSSTAR